MAADNRDLAAKPDMAAKPRALARIGWFVAYWAAGVLCLTAVGLVIRWALKI
ncbi:DUF2474 domain-containing protein [Bosea sp. AAP35]|uniref:DUF2474 domain-containing protein n=1 Tax=Bosea sp. AAP35 TaxID=1523417 RepID=UPI000AAAEB67|nr:DUF2474 domain-containing protein [Bosea sp. AAP35]